MTRHTPDYNLPAPEPSSPVVTSNDFWQLALKIDSSLRESLWYEATPLTASDNLDTLGSGVRTIWSGSLAAQLGLPVSAQYAITTVRWGASGGVQTAEARTADGTVTYKRRLLSGGWSTWTRSDVTWWEDITLTADDDLSELPDGGRPVYSGAVASALGLPEEVGGMLETYRWGVSGGVQIFRTRSRPVRTWERALLSGGWTGWVRTDAAAAVDLIPTTPGGPAAVRSSGHKVIPLILTAGNSGSSSCPATGTVAYPLNWEAPINRFRVVIADRNPRYNIERNTTVTLTNVRHAGGQIAATGSFSGMGGRYVSPWTDGHPTGNLEFSYSASAEVVGLVGGGTLNSSSVTTMPFDVWVEAETPVSTPVIAVGGDSNSVGVGTTIPVHDSWLSQYCRRIGALPVHYGASGDSYRGWLDPDSYKWNRWAHLDHPDVMIMAWGSNDAGREGPASEIIADAETVWDIAAQKVATTQHAIAIKPRNSGTPGYNTARRGYNDWVKTRPHGIRTWHDMVTPVSTDDTVMLPGMYASDGTHMTTAGHHALADSITQPVTVSGKTQVTEISVGVYKFGV